MSLSLSYSQHCTARRAAAAERRSRQIAQTAVAESRSSQRSRTIAKNSADDVEEVAAINSKQQLRYHLPTSHFDLSGSSIV